jgi:hypothetical protein
MRPLVGHSNPVWAVTFSPNNRHVVTGSDDGIIEPFGGNGDGPQLAVATRSGSLAPSGTSCRCYAHCSTSSAGVWWGGDWRDPIDEMHFQLNYAEGSVVGGSFVENVDQRLIDLAGDLDNGYLGIWKPADPNAFPLPHGYFYGPFDGPARSISGEFPGEPQTWRDGLGRWQEALGLPVTKVWHDGKTAQAATTLQMQKRWPPTPEIGYGCVYAGEWYAVIKDGWRLPAEWDPATVVLGAHRNPMSSLCRRGISGGRSTGRITAFLVRTPMSHGLIRTGWVAGRRPSVCR